jgi:hypothetical protein
MTHSADEIAIYVLEAGQIIFVAGLGLALTAIMLDSACQILWTLPRGWVRRGGMALCRPGFRDAVFVAGRS